MGTRRRSSSKTSKANWTTTRTMPSRGCAAVRRRRVYRGSAGRRLRRGDGAAAVPAVRRRRRRQRDARRRAGVRARRRQRRHVRQLALARAAGAARRAEGGAAVYLSLVTARPHHPLHAPYGVDCSRPSLYAFHLWDWIAAMSVGAPAGATTAWPQGSAAIRAAASDVALGRALLEQWLTFAGRRLPAGGVGWRRRQRPRLAAALRPRRHRRGRRDDRSRRFEGGGVRSVGGRRRGRGVLVDQLVLKTKSRHRRVAAARARPRRACRRRPREHTHYTRRATRARR